jgi:ABC-type transport system involved in cytochrome c biogenesis permease component
VAYLVIGRTFAWPAAHVQAWRVAAWLASGAVFAAHIAYEHFRRGHSPRAAAWHVALGVAVGGFTLAVAGAIYSLSTTSTSWRSWLLALVAWPLITAVPAFLVALASCAVLARVRRSRGSQ